MRSRLTPTPFFIAACALSTAANSVFAHDGHAMSGAHWHATDALGFVVVGCLAGVAIWLSGRGK